VGSGAGGQKRNKTANCVRCTHAESGAVGKSEEGRSQVANKRKAFVRMSESPKFKSWIRIESAKRLGVEAEVEKQVGKDMHSKNLKVEMKDKNNKWTPYKDKD